MSNNLRVLVMLYSKHHDMVSMGQVLFTELPTIYRRSLSSVRFARVKKPPLHRNNDTYSPSTSEQPTEMFTLSNGHRMSYSICGPQNSPVVFFLHGYPSSRIEGLLLSKMSTQVGVRMVSPDRPGIGFSTFDPHRRILDYPDHISQLASRLQLRSYSILGCSAGAPYAIACAKLLPKRQLNRVGILAGWGPLDLGLNGIGMKLRIALNLTWWMPRFTRLFMNIRESRGPDVKTLRDRLEQRWHSLTPAQRNIFLANPDMIARIVGIRKEHWRQGSEGSVKECQLLTQPWGFRLEDVDYENIMLWYGTEDVNTPVQMGRKMGARLKKARLKEYLGDNHWTLGASHGEKILGAMLNGYMGS